MRDNNIIDYITELGGVSLVGDMDASENDDDDNLRELMLLTMYFLRLWLMNLAMLKI